MGLQSTQGYRGKLVDKLTGTILDQFSDEDIKVSNNILELFDLGEIPGTYTRQITLPGTKKNNAFFEQYYDISVWEPDLFNTNQVVEAYLDFDGFYLVNGYLQLNKVNVLANKFVDSYEVTLFGIISNFSIDTRASFLTDITSLSAYNHTSSLANITASWDKQLFSGSIVYPMAEYGSPEGPGIPTIYYSNTETLGIDDSDGAMCVQDYKPAIRLKLVWDAIFSQFGYTYTGSFWNQAWLDDVYLLLNNNQRTPIYPESIETYLQANLINISASGTALTANTTASFPINAKEYDYNNAYDLEAGSFKLTTPITTKFDVGLNLAFTVATASGAGSGMPQFKLYYTNYNTNAVYATQSLSRLNTQLDVIRQSRGNVVTETFNIKDYLITTPTLPNGTYNVKIFYAPTGSTNFSVLLNPNFENQSSIRFRKAKQAADGKVLDVPSNMPFGTSGIRVMDFIRGIQKKFNLIIYPDKQNPNQFVVETFNNWYKQGVIKDFNKYINLQDKISFTPANQLAYRQIRFSDETDNDYISTLFGRQYNRTFGESNFYDTGSFYSQNTLDVTANKLAAGPIGLVPGSGYSGSAANQTCTTYRLVNRGENFIQYTYTLCNGAFSGIGQLGPLDEITFCAQTETLEVTDPNYNWEVYLLGDCSPGGNQTISGSNYPVYIPYYISDQNYTPTRVLPRLMFYNGKINSPSYYFEGYPLPSTSSVSQSLLTQYPYFDNYSTGSLSGTSSIYPQTNARSLLFNNEEPVWGTTPSGSLVSEYWAKYLALLYNPRTRLVDATAVIPLADYFDLELNDIAEFRGNYYHLRAINDYNLTTGECNIQMLGPIIADTISNVLSGSFAPTVDNCGFTYTATLDESLTFDFMNITSSAGVAGGPVDAYTNGFFTYIVGNYTCYNGTSSYDLTKIRNDGTIDTSFNTTIGTSGSNIYSGVQDAGLYGFTLQKSNGLIIICGPTNYWNGVNVSPSGSITASFIRLNTTGTRDTTFDGYLTTPWNTGQIPSSVDSFGTGKLVVGTQAGGAYITNANGTYSASVNVPGGGGRSEVRVNAGPASGSDDGTFYVLKVGAGQTSNSIRKYNNNGSLDTGYSIGGGPTGNPQNYSLAVQSDKKVLVVGRWGQWDGYGSDRFQGIVRLGISGSVDTTFNFNATGSGFVTGSAVYVQSDGKILYAVRNSSTVKLYRLTNSGSVDLEYNVQTGSYASAYTDFPDGFGRLITSITRLNNGNVLAVGSAFTELEGNKVEGWTQLYDSSGSKINNNLYLC